MNIIVEVYWDISKVHERSKDGNITTPGKLNLPHVVHIPGNIPPNGYNKWLLKKYGWKPSEIIFHTVIN